MSLGSCFIAAMTAVTSRRLGRLGEVGTVPARNNHPGRGYLSALTACPAPSRLTLVLAGPQAGGEANVNYLR